MNVNEILSIAFEKADKNLGLKYPFDKYEKGVKNYVHPQRDDSLNAKLTPKQGYKYYHQNFISNQIHAEMNRYGYYGSKDILKLEQYSKTAPVKILERLQDYLKKENLNDLVEVIFNFGKRNKDSQLRGMSNSYVSSNAQYQFVDGYTVFENEKTYTFTKKSDCKGIEADYLDAFILSRKYFIKLSIGEEGVIQRVHQIWKRDVKKIDIYQSVMVEIYFHGYYDPEILVLESYEKALDLQRKLIDLREKY